MNICYRLFLEYIDTKKIIKVNFWFKKSVEEPKITPIDGIKSFFIRRVEDFFNILFLLKTWEIGQKSSIKVIKAWSLFDYLNLFAINIIVILKNNY